MNEGAAGARAAAEAIRAVDQSLRVETVHPRTLHDRIRSAVADGATRIIAAGGDGTLCAAARALAGTNTELAIVPAGTLNHFARDLGLPTRFDDAIPLAVRAGETRCIDVAAVNDHVFLNTSSVGIYTGFVRMRDRLEHRLGYRVASALAGIGMLFRLRTTEVTLQVDGATRTYRTPLVFIGVGERELRVPSLGARVPNGRRGLHVMVVRSRSAARLLALTLSAVARGLRAVSRTPALDAFLVDECTIATRHRSVAVDGEIVTADPPLRFQLLPDALRVVVPPARS